MPDVRAVRTLDEFQDQAEEVVRHLRQTGEPLALTVDGEEAIVVQDAPAYRSLLERLEHAESVAALRFALAQGDRGETLPAREALEALRQRYDIPR